MNRVELLGRLVDIKEFEKSKKVTLAIKRDYKNKDGEYDTDFIDCFAFQKTGEYIKNNSEKGTAILITGSIHKNKKTYKDVTYYEHEIWVEKAVVFGKPEKKEETNPTFNNEDLPF